MSATSDLTSSNRDERAEQRERVLLKLGWERKVHDGYELWVYRVPSDPLTGTTSGEPFEWHSDKVIVQMIEWLLKRGNLELYGPDDDDAEVTFAPHDDAQPSVQKSGPTLAEALCVAVVAVEAVDPT